VKTYLAGIQSLESFKVEYFDPEFDFDGRMDKIEDEYINYNKEADNH